MVYKWYINILCICSSFFLFRNNLLLFSYCTVMLLFPEDNARTHMAKMVVSPYGLLWRQLTMAQPDPAHFQIHSQSFQTAKMRRNSVCFRLAKRLLLSRAVVVLICMLCTPSRTAHECCQHVKENQDSLSRVNQRIFINQKCILEDS